MDRETIRSRFHVVTEYIKNPLKPHLERGRWTDDTALTFATLTSITNVGAFDLEDIELNIKAMFSMQPYRGYGRTTSRALGERIFNTRARSNGAAMRIAPVALLFHGDLERMRGAVTQSSMLTHQNPEAVNGALAVAFAIAKAARAELEPPKLIAETIDFIGVTSGVSQRLKLAKGLLEETASLETAFERLGTSSSVFDTVASAFFCLLRTPGDFEASVIAAANAGGDSDTIAAITGNISGAYNGERNIPARFLRRLEKAKELLALAERLERVTP